MSHEKEKIKIAITVVYLFCFEILRILFNQWWKKGVFWTLPCYCIKIHILSIICWLLNRFQWFQRFLKTIFSYSDEVSKTKNIIFLNRLFKCCLYLYSRLFPPPHSILSFLWDVCGELYDLVKKMGTIEVRGKLKFCSVWSFKG